MYKKFYTSFLKRHEGEQHFACHSHYYWPDVTRQAMLDFWDDSAKYVDEKWTYFYTSKVPVAQKHIAQSLNLNNPEQIVFAPNTHEFVMRILSCLDWTRKVRVLTTDSEFYSFERQINRLGEMEQFEITKIPVFPFENFEERFIQAIEHQTFDLVFFSQVFFNSGIPVRSLESIVESVKNPMTIVVIDGYHGFRSIPTDLGKIQNRVFYLAGSYKYAQAGEGCCFLHVPPNTTLRPAYTGWFADFATLGKEKDGKVNYAGDGNRFAGATLDFSALYRLISVFELFKNEGLTQDLIHAYIQRMQNSFLEEIAKYDHPLINRKRLLVDNLNRHGHFLTFKLDNADQVEKMANLLKEHKIYTDYRGDRLRFGFALYHDGQYDMSVLNTRRAYFFDELIF